jgi:hypothetical protein
MKQVYFGVVGSIAVVLLLVVGCGGGSSNSKPEPGTTANGFTSYTADGFSVSVPSEWSVFSGEELKDVDLSQFERDNPALGTINPEDYALLAADPTRAGGFATSLNVVVGAAPEGRSAGDDLQAALEQIKSLPIDQTSLRSEVIDLPAGEAIHLAYTIDFKTGAGTTSVAASQYGLYADGQSYLLTFETAADQLAAHEADFESSARSFRVD